MVDVDAPLAADRSISARDAERRRNADAADKADQRPRLIGDEGACAARRQQGDLVTHLKTVEQPVRKNAARLALNRDLVIIPACGRRGQRIGPQHGNALHKRLHDNALPRLKTGGGKAFRNLKAKRPHIFVARDNVETSRLRPKRLRGELGELRQAAAADRPGPGLRRELFHRCSPAAHSLKQIVARDAHALANELIVDSRTRRSIDGRQLLNCGLHFHCHDIHLFLCLIVGSDGMSWNVLCGFPLQRPNGTHSNGARDPRHTARPRNYGD